MQQEDTQRQQLAAGEEAVIELHEGSASHVTLRRSADGMVTLQGAGLWNIRCACCPEMCCSWKLCYWLHPPQESMPH